MVNKCKKRDFSLEELRSAWANDKKIIYKCKKYRVGKMSYGDYFIEPISERMRGETEGFSKKTLWLEKKIKKKSIVFEVDD